MNFLKSLFAKKEKSEELYTHDTFWNWFKENQQQFFNAIKNQQDIEKDFFDKLSPELIKFGHDFYFVAGMKDENTAELIITADGVIKNIVFVEDLIKDAPILNNWVFTALKKPAVDIQNIGIQMGDYNFDKDNLSFYAIKHYHQPDEVDIVITYDKYNEEDKQLITNGVYIFLDNYLGELESITTIDNLKIISKAEAKEELIPIDKLKDYLIWREKEFIEQYQGTRRSTDNDNYSMFEGELGNGNPLLAAINIGVLNWDKKASHPWICSLLIHYKSENNGLPSNHDYEVLNQIEDEIMIELKDDQGYINIGRETANEEREIYFACREFRKPSKVLHQIQQKYKNQFKIDINIYKDKYWQSFDRFIKH